MVPTIPPDTGQGTRGDPSGKPPAGVEAEGGEQEKRLSSREKSSGRGVVPREGSPARISGLKGVKPRGRFGALALEE